MNRRQLLGAAVSLALGGAWSSSTAEPRCNGDGPLAKSFALDYEVRATRSVLALAGEGSLRFERIGDAYTMASAIRALGVYEAHQNSRGRIDSTGLIPQAYEERGGRRRSRSARLDWQAGKVSMSEARESFPTQPQMQDRLSMLLQLALRHRAKPQASAIDMTVVGVRRISSYRFAVEERPEITVPAGRFDTVKFERHRDDDEMLEIWLAPSLCALPVRLRYTQDKSLVIDQQLRAVRFD